MDIKKKAFIKAYVQSFGNITKSCEAIDISRQGYYNWVRDDEEFKAALEAAEPAEVFVDFAEDGLVKRIKAEDTTAIIFALKTRGKKRGYVERHEFSGPGGRPIQTEGKHIVEFRDYGGDNTVVQSAIQAGIRN